MRQQPITLPELALIAGTRVALGIGLGLLLSERLNEDTRRGAGWALVAFGALSTIPLAVGVFGKRLAIRPPERRVTPAWRGVPVRRAA
jgi:hypothetical protein